LGVQDRLHVSTTVVSTALAAGISIRRSDLPLMSTAREFSRRHAPEEGSQARANTHPGVSLPDSIRWPWPFVPKPTCGAHCHGCRQPDLGATVCQRPLASTAGGGDCYSLGCSAGNDC